MTFFEVFHSFFMTALSGVIGMLTVLFPTHAIVVETPIPTRFINPTQIEEPISETPTENPVDPALVEETALPVLTEEPTVAPEVPDPILPVPEQPQIPTSSSFSLINEEVRGALVNIVCTTAASGPLRPITGSGIFIDPRGIILTNAHVAQYFLLEDYPIDDFVDCVVRMGSPARALYSAELMYIAPEWIHDNAHNIVEQSPRGTGENDYALLAITGSTNPNGALPASFPAVLPDTREESISLGKSVLVAGYPAGFLGGISIQKDLYSVSAVTAIREIFTFEGDTEDLISVGGSVVAQPGSSGGGVVDEHHNLLGIVVTSSVESTTAERDLRAITLSHISRSMEESLGITLSTFLSGSLPESVAAFERVYTQPLRQPLIDALEAQ